MVSGNGYINNISRNIGRVGGGSTVGGARTPAGSQEAFGAIFRDKLLEREGVRFSKHAELRLASRDIRFTEAQMAGINEAVRKAEAKGVRDTLVLTEDAALVVNVKSRTVITAMDRAELKDNVFTNIDGAIIT